jgi:glutaconate CoA-transferase subunit B
MSAPVRREELLIHCISKMLEPCRHVAVGVLSPIPGGAALLARAKWGTRLTILGATDPEFASDGAGELFDLAAQGKVDAFFLSGGQIDGAANINLTGAGGYPQSRARWSGAFGSAFLYFQVPRVILFRESHEKRAFPEKVDFVTAPGASPEGTWRRGGPHALVTELCVFAFDRAKGRFRLESVHPGVTPEEVRERTGFAYEAPATVPETEAPDAETLALIRGEVAEALAGVYPEFAARTFGEAARDALSPAS